MSVDTEIIINAKWGSDNIKDFLNAHFEMDSPAEERQTHTPSYTTILFTLKGGEQRQLNYHREYPTPLGNAVLLTLGMWGRAQEIMKTIGESLGGFYQPCDSTEDYQLFRGMIYPHDGLAYFLEHAVLEGKMTSPKDLDGLTEYIKECNKKHLS